MVLCVVFLHRQPRRRWEFGNTNTTQKPKPNTKPRNPPLSRRARVRWIRCAQRCLQRSARKITLILGPQSLRTSARINFIWIDRACSSRPALATAEPPWTRLQHYVWGASLVFSRWDHDTLGGQLSVRDWCRTEASCRPRNAKAIGEIAGILAGVIPGWSWQKRLGR